LSLAAPRADQAILSALRAEGVEISRQQLRTWIEEGHVLISGVRLSRAAQEISAGEYELTLPDPPGPPQAAAIRPEELAELDVPTVYEDRDLLVLHKPTGIPSMPQDSAESRTAVGVALAYCPAIAQVGRGAQGERGGLEPGLIHRLDTGTSGLLVFAKHQDEYERLRLLWRERSIRKVYRAITPSPDSPWSLPLRIGTPLAHDAKSAKRMMAWTPDTRASAFRGKPLQAVTWIREARDLYAGGLDLTIEIETGVMHQIRCHLSTLGVPILGDPVYRGAPGHRLWLHAWQLYIPLADGAALHLIAALPPGWPSGDTP
jgi:23S rRNA pseudouridine1911/1915/1917 synthase